MPDEARLALMVRFPCRSDFQDTMSVGQFGLRDEFLIDAVEAQQAAAGRSQAAARRGRRLEVSCG